VATWSHHNFDDVDGEPSVATLLKVLGVAEEVGELAHSVLKRHQKIRLDEDHNAKIRDAVGDIIIYLLNFCDVEHILLSECLLNAWAEVQKRDWAKHREAKMLGPKYKE
jgi:NTP pyrophosphatase (non-canonical NTP hydrolase)